MATLDFSLTTADVLTPSAADFALGTPPVTTVESVESDIAATLGLEAAPEVHRIGSVNLDTTFGLEAERTEVHRIGSVNLDTTFGLEAERTELLTIDIRAARATIGVPLTVGVAPQATTSVEAEVVVDIDLDLTPFAFGWQPVQGSSAIWTRISSPE